MRRLIGVFTALVLFSAVAAVAAEVPNTIKHPRITDTNGYIIFVGATDDRDTRLDRPWWRAPYLFTTPYSPNSGWGAGDRNEYRCAYGFLIDGGSLVKNSQGDVFDRGGGEVIGRFTFHLVPGSESYSIVNDKYMVESVNGVGGRNYDGSIAFKGDGKPTCPRQEAGLYEPSNLPDQRPVIVFRNAAGQVVEIRDYRGISTQSPGVKFRLGDSPDHDVTVLAYENNLPVIVVYYDALGSGSIEAFIP